ncbi:hypothetical protein [Peribacillus simplex]|uniref:hypothetical protein n=1 Tax=Peribacillus simplex TaxID=1478 RepID=UPI0028531EEF|nr:hypothetical protein [Peribacillus simplex]MDR4928916.1 hypothetical protein [Peribacillus simplex]
MKKLAYLNKFFYKFFHRRDYKKILRNTIIITSSTFVLILIPYLVNKLMGFNVTKVYGKTDTWIGFLGSYIGSVISGFVTLFGVMLSLKFTKYEAMKDKLPEKIEHLEECIDFIDESIDRLSVLERVDVLSEIAKPIHLRPTKLYHLDPNYNLTPKKNPNIDTTIDEYLKSSKKTIRKHLIKVNAEAHVRQNQFSHRLKKHYDVIMNPIEQRVENFQSIIIDAYKETHADEITTGYLVRIDLNDEHSTMLNTIIRDIHLAELKYLGSIIEIHDGLKDDLLVIFRQLTRKLDY